MSVECCYVRHCVTVLSCQLGDQVAFVLADNLSSRGQCRVILLSERDRHF